MITVFLGLDPNAIAAANRKRENEAMKAKLIRDNRNAPADKLIRGIFDAGATNVRDEEGERYESAEEALDMWYSVDELTLIFDLHPEPSCFVQLIHQRSFAAPQYDDLVDYSLVLNDHKVIGPLLRMEGVDPIYLNRG